MPVEGQWERQQTPLRRLTRRERRLLQATAAVLLVATVVVVLIAVLKPEPAVPAGCLQVTAPSTMGAVNVRVCGANVPRFCAQQAGKDDPTARAVQARCRALAVSPRRAPS
jgi:hypothetical protein